MAPTEVDWRQLFILGNGDRYEEIFTRFIVRAGRDRLGIRRRYVTAAARDESAAAASELEWVLHHRRRRLWDVEPTAFVPATTRTTTDGGRGWLGLVGGGCDYEFPVSGFGNFVIGAFGDYDFMGP